MPFAQLASTARSLAISLVTHPAVAVAGGGRPRRQGAWRWRTPSTTGPAGPTQQRTRGDRVRPARARYDDDDEDGDGGPLSTAAKAADTAADALAGFLPDSIPRPAAKVGILVIGGTVLLSFVGKVISTVAFVGALGAGGWLLYQANNPEGDGGGGGRKGSGGGGGGSAADALEEARRVMAKYMKK